jgi:hypothetical protein
VNLGFENKKKTIWAAALGVVALLVFAYQFIPMFTGSSEPSAGVQAAAPVLPHTAPPRPGKAALKIGKKTLIDSLDPTLRLDLLATSEKTQYEGNGRNIFVSSGRARERLWTGGTRSYASRRVRWRFRMSLEADRRRAFR